jgi:hypothetical protein
MLEKPSPTDQRAPIRPISFVLENAGRVVDSVVLPIRPEDLTRTEPARSTVHQTMGKDVQGWVDNFGAGLPSVQISGHTGWLYQTGVKRDGFGSFEALNKLVAHDYHAARQAAIDAGRDPSAVKLIFVDTLDNFFWVVEPMQFVLRRSKSRPLLFQYSIALQAISTSVDNPLRFVPSWGSQALGLGALDDVIGRLESFSGSIQGWVSDAVSFVDRALAPIGSAVKDFLGKTVRVFRAVSTAVTSVNNGIKGVANRLISIASDLAKAGTNVMRTFQLIGSIPTTLKAALGRVAGAFNEVLCILNNSLRPRRTYEDYTGLYGASNCSSTTGGRPASIYTGNNVFDLMRTDKASLTATGDALSSVARLSRTDPVLAPAPINEAWRHIGNINQGLSA